jgi:tetratricopeptide (TPR) repeat protein
LLVALFFFQQVGHEVYVAQAQRLALSLRERFGAEVFDTLWAELARGEPPDWLVAPAAIPAAEQPVLAAFFERLQAYGTAQQDADHEQPDPATWQAITELGEALLAEEARGWAVVDWAALRATVASAYNTLGNAHDHAGDPSAALAAFERAIALQPDFAMWQRNRVGTLIALGRLAPARTALAAARTLEPDAPRLADLEAALAQAEGQA